MKSYIAYFKLKFISGLQYRTAAYAGVFTQMFFGLLNIMVFLAFFESGNKSSDMSITQIASYFWLNQSFFALVNQFYKDRELFDLVKKGNISYELARPKSIYFMWFAKIYGTRLAMVSLRLLPMLIIAVILPAPYNLVGPASFIHLLVAIIALIIGSFLVTAIITLYPIITLRTLSEKGITQFVICIADLLSGMVIPIPFFPRFLKIISACLPFQYISDLSFRIYVGNIGITSGLIGISLQIVWLIIIVFISYILLNRSLKRVEVQGG